jgi:STE24 endopeptidase
MSDAELATEAYLKTLSPEALSKAVAYTQGGYLVELGGLLVMVILTILLLKLRLFSKLDLLIQAKKPRPWTAAFVHVFIYTILMAILSLPWMIYAQWYREKEFGLTSQPLFEFLTEAAISQGISAVILGLLMMFIYGLIRRAGQLWWVWAGGVSSIFMAGLMVASPIFLEPIFNTYTPVPEGAVRAAIVDMAKVRNIPTDKIFYYDGSKQSNRYTANVAGLFGSARIAISDTMLKKGADMAEIRAVVAHEMGHYALLHTLRSVAFVGISAMTGFFLVNLLFGPLGALLGQRGVQLSDPSQFLILSLLISLIAYFYQPISNSYTRLGETEADRFSMELAGEPDGMARALIKTAEYRAPSPSDLEETLFYTHPSVEKRIRRAMEWKYANPPKKPA